jgi:hypothetical protein
MLTFDIESHNLADDEKSDDDFKHLKPYELNNI